MPKTSQKPKEKPAYIISSLPIASSFPKSLKKLMFSFRLEEFIALIAFIPMTYLTFKAYFFFKAQGHVPVVVTLLVFSMV